MKYLIFGLLISIHLVSNAQMFSKHTVKAGNSVSGQLKNPKEYYDDYIDFRIGFASTIEPTICSFGSKKQFDFNTEFSFIQKGGHCTSFKPYNGGMGTYPLIINYFSISPVVKFNFFKKFFVKAGVRTDKFLSFKAKDLFELEQRTAKDFNSFTYGITYGFGICIGQKKVRFIAEFTGQNDFTNSTYNSSSGQTYKNYSYLINFGVQIILIKSR